MLYGTIDKTTIDSTVSIKFTENIAIPENSYDEIMASGYITLEVSGPQPFYDYSWYIDSITSLGINFIMNFTDPLEIGMYSVSFC